MKEMYLRHTAIRLAAVLLMVFATPLSSQAQLGGLMKKAKDKAKNAVRNTVKDAPAEADPYGPAQLEVIRMNKERADKPQASSKENPIYEGSGDKQVATWNDETKTFTLARTYADGDLAGQPILYQLDEATGELRRNDGQLMGKIVEGGVEVPGVGTVTIDTQRGGGLNLNGKGIGKATRTEAYCYGHQLAHFRREATREIVTLFSLVEFGKAEDMAAWKTSMEKRHEREAAAQSAFKDKLKKVTAGNFLDVAGNKIGSITDKGLVLNKLGEQIGVVKANGQVTDAYNRSLGRIEDGGGLGVVYRGNDRIGQLQPNGSVEMPSRTPSNIGKIIGSDFYDSNSNRIARFTGDGIYVAAACYYFFFTLKN